MAPAMRQWPAGDQMYMPRQRWGRTQVVTVAVNIPTQLLPVRWVAMVVVRRSMLMLLKPGCGLAMHLPLVLPQPLALPLGMPLLLARGVAMLRLMLVMMLVRLALIMRLARSIRPRGGADRAGKQGHAE